MIRGAKREYGKMNSKQAIGDGKMKHKSKPMNPVNLDSGQRRDLDEIIKNLRKDVISPKIEKKDAPSHIEEEQPDSAGVQKTGVLNRRSGVFHRGLLGVLQRIPA